jgi:hypothetical protein
MRSVAAANLNPVKEVVTSPPLGVRRARTDYPFHGLNEAGAELDRPDAQARRSVVSADVACRMLAAVQGPGGPQLFGACSGLPAVATQDRGETNMKLSIRRLSIGAVIACVMLGSQAPIAAAASLNYGVGHSISGCVYSSGDWYYSANLRYRTSGANSSLVVFNTVPNGSLLYEDGLKFYVIDGATSVRHGIVISPPLYTGLPLANGDAPYSFRNVYAVLQPGSRGFPGGGSLCFDGYEYY